MKLPWSKPEEKSSAALIALAQLPGATWGGHEPAALVRDGFAGNAVVYRCARMIAEAAASIAFKCEDPAAQRLLEEPSPDEAGQALFERLYTDLQIAGNAWMEAVTLDGDARPRGLFGLRPDCVKIRQDDRGRLLGYAVRLHRGERVLTRANDGWLPVFHLRLYHPGDSRYGLSPLSAARKALDVHNSSAGWAKALIDNAARPSGALMYGKDGARLTDEQFERLKTQLVDEHAGAANAGRPLLLEGGLEWKPMSLSPAEMDFAETRHAAAREIALAFGVPPMLLGIEDLATRAGTAIDASQIGGALDGFAIDGVTSLAGGLTPLATAFEFDLQEGQAGLRAAQEPALAASVLAFDEAIEDSLQNTRTLLDKQPDAVSLSYISADSAYQQAVVEARDLTASTGLTVSYQLPLVLSDGRAEALAARLLDQDLKFETCTLSIPSGRFESLCVSDRVRFQDTDWIVQRLEEQGLERRLHLRKPRLQFERPQAIDPPIPNPSAVVSAVPFAKLLDIPVLEHLDALPPFIAGSADPWRGRYPVRMGTDPFALTDRALISQPSGIGQIESDIPAGVSEHWDTSAQIEIFMPGETLSSLPQSAIEAGRNWLLIERAEGWEALAWLNAEMTGEARWTLSWLWRGLAGTEPLGVQTGAVAVLADERLVPLRVSARDVGADLVWQIAESELQTFTYRDVAGRFSAAP